LGVLFLVVFVDLLGFGMVIPTMPLYARHFGVSEAVTGFLSAGYSAMQLIFAPIWGRLSDRYGRRPMLLGSIAMTAIGFLGYAIAPSFEWLLVSRLFAGAATANLAIARAYVADVTPPEERAGGMAIIGISFGLGFILGPAMGGLLSSRWSLAAPGYAAAALATVNLVAAFFILREPESHAVAGHRPRFSALFEELRRPGIGGLLMVSFLSILAFSALENTFAFLAADQFRIDAHDVSYVFVYIGVLAVLVQGGLIRPLVRRFGEQKLLVAGLALQAVSIALLPFAGSITGMLVVLAPMSLGNGLTQPALAALLSKLAKREDQGGTMGLGESASAFGRIIGPITGTASYALYRGFPYLAGGLLMAVAAVLASRLAAAAAPIPAEEA
jgi:DHA1 family tetracycline resistance protein-like MFS transporter